MKILGVVNPVSGAGRGPILWREGLAVMPDLFGDSGDHLILTTPDLEEWSSELADHLKGDDIELLVVSGGDGAHHQVFSLLSRQSEKVRNKLKVFLMPGGRGNDGVRGNYGFGDKPELFWQWAKGQKWEASPMDLLQVNGDICYNVASFGYGGAVVEALHDTRSFWKKTSASYVVEGMLQFLKTKPVEMTGDDFMEEVLAVFLLNGPCNGKGLFWNADSNTRDGKAELLRLPPLSPLKFFSALDALKKKRPLPVPHGLSAGEQFTFSFREPVAYELDGEFKGRESKFEVKVLKGVCNLLRPSGLA